MIFIFVLIICFYQILIDIFFLKKFINFNKNHHITTREEEEKFIITF
ncbi:hypothetical protein [Moraxella lacunata]